MDFQLNEQQEMFKRMLSDFVNKEIKPVARELEHSGTYPTEIVKKMKELGLFGMTIPELYGGLGLDSISMALVFEELSRGWMGIAGVLGTHSLACAMMSRFGTKQQKEKYLPDLATGKRRTGIGLTEPGAGSDLQGITTVANDLGDHYVVNGAKMWITNARHADPLPILVKTDKSALPRHKGMSILLVDTTSDGFSVSRDIPKLGYKGPESCEIILQDLAVPKENLLGGVEGQGLQQALWALQLGRINIAARGIGLSQAAFEDALSYSRSRTAFGSPIGDFQAIQLKLADMATEIQAARLLTWWAAWRNDTMGRADKETGMAKLFASELALRTSLEAMRIHGGYGYSTEFEVERYYRDAPLLAIGEGTNEILRTVIAKALKKEFEQLA